MSNKKFRSVCLLTGICAFLVSGCNFGSQEETPEADPPVQNTQQNIETETPDEEVTAEENIPIGAPEERDVYKRQVTSRRAYSFLSAGVRLSVWLMSTRWLVLP